jgi:subtilisin family serine protease
MKGNGIPKDFAAQVAALGGAVTFAHGPTGFVAVSGITADAAKKLGAIAGVSEVDADAVVSLEARSSSAQADAAGVRAPSINTVEDPTTAGRYAFQWNMRLINADKAWAAGKLGSSNVTVAIIDTGIDYDDLDLVGHVDLSRSHSFMDSYVLATDEKERGLPSDNAVTAKYFSNRDSIQDYAAHGTNVATQVVSNAVRFAGVTSKTKLIGVKVLGSNGSGNFSQIFSGILWAADHGANIANMSLGGAFLKAGSGRLVGAINRIFNYAKQQNMLIVVSAGNESADLQHNGNVYSGFCDSPHVVCVSSVGPKDGLLNQNEPAVYTNYGSQAISVGAPGGNINFGTEANPFPVSDRPWGPDYASWVWSLCSRTWLAGFDDDKVPVLAGCGETSRLGFVGTSQASPHVAGLAAQLLAAHPGASATAIKHLIEQSAATPAGWNRAYGRGRIDVAAALGL